MPIVTRHEYDPVDHIDQYVLAIAGNPDGPYVTDAGESALCVGDWRRFYSTYNVRKARKFSLAADAMAFKEENLREFPAILPVRVRTPVTATPAEMLD